MTYDQWKTRSPDNDYDENEGPDYEFESLLDSLVDRDMVWPGFHRDGGLLIEVFNTGDVEILGYVVLPSCVGWEPKF
jgi:hypothetical protein